MKTSYILLTILALVTLTGMVATDVLLKQQYNTIDWRNPYQQFDTRRLPTARHWVIEGTSTTEIVVLESADKPQALIAPDFTRYYHTQQQGDTVFVTFTPDDTSYQLDPREDASRELGVRLVLRLPALQTLRIKDGRVTLSELKKDSLWVIVQNSRLRTAGGKLNSFSVVARQNSFITMGPNQYGSIQATVQDSSGIWLNDTQVNNFTVQASPKADVQLKGRALSWLK
ncbi:hypothetical protein [Spirosoma spitsbergense]|uniref:hypothetical protein n=1 Tax=Spirosoma spitsbergense TaxID=431554 RepID=UPI00036F8BFE|nr:hypothetical protein [Spirosoma spitsbergense]